MPENVPAVPSADRYGILHGVTCDIRQVRPVCDEIGKNHAAVPGIVGQQRENIELGVIRAAVINQFDAGADAVDVGLDRFERVGSANRWNIPSDTHGDLELQA